MIEEDIKSLLSFLERELKNMSLYSKELFVQQIVENFFSYIQSNLNQDEQEKIYILIERAFLRMKIDIKQHIQKR